MLSESGCNRNKAIKDLCLMNNELLTDIGISRGQIRDVVDSMLEVNCKTREIAQRRARSRVRKSVIAKIRFFRTWHKHEKLPVKVA